MTRVHTITTVFKYSDYKSCLRAIVVESELTSKGVRANLARFIQCQQAYLSRVLNGDAEFSLEQAHAAARYFVMSASETSFFVAMVGENRAATPDLKDYWRKQLASARDDQRDLGRRLQLTDQLSGFDLIRYYGCWYFAAIHIAVSIPELQTVDALCSYLRLKDDVVRNALEFLIASGLVEKVRHLYRMTERNIHLSRHNMVIPQHHTNWKLRSIESLLRPSANQVHYTGVISIGREDIEKMNELVQDAVERARELVKSSPEEILGCYQFGFFEVGGNS